MVPQEREGLEAMAGPEMLDSISAFPDAVAAVLPAAVAGVRASGDPLRVIETLAVCGGAGDSLLGEAARVAEVGAPGWRHGNRTPAGLAHGSDDRSRAHALAVLSPEISRDRRHGFASRAAERHASGADGAFRCLGHGSAHHAGGRDHRRGRGVFVVESEPPLA